METNRGNQQLPEQEKFRPGQQEEPGRNPQREQQEVSWEDDEQEDDRESSEERNPQTDRSDRRL